MRVALFIQLNCFGATTIKKDFGEGFCWNTIFTPSRKTWGLLLRNDYQFFEVWS